MPKLIQEFEVEAEDFDEPIYIHLLDNGTIVVYKGCDSIDIDRGTAIHLAHAIIRQTKSN